MLAKLLLINFIFLPIGDKTNDQKGNGPTSDGTRTNEV